MARTARSTSRRKPAKRSRGTRAAPTALILPGQQLERRILLIRGQKVLLDADLARLYGVQTKALNQAVRRNAERFPADFMFELNEAEKREVVAEMEHAGKLRYSAAAPLVFTEQGVAMLSGVLRSKRAVAVNIEIMRAFVRLRRAIAAHDELARRLDQLEQRIGQRAQFHEDHIKKIWEVLDEFREERRERQRSRIGFRAPESPER